jgi:putative endonuclease
MNYYVYILKMIDGRLYVGMTNHIHRRESEHGIKSGARTTYIFGAGQMIYSESHSDRVSAHQRERQIKKWSHAKKMALAKGDLNLLKDLSKKKNQPG